MSFDSKAILWLQADAYYLFHFESNSKSFNLFKTYGVTQNPRGIAQDLSQIGINSIILYVCHQSGYLLDADLNMSKSQWVELLRSKDIIIESQDLIRCQTAGHLIYLQVLSSDTADEWQNAMDEYKVVIESIDFPEQACLSLLPKNFKQRGCLLSIGHFQSELSMQWEFDPTKFIVLPIKWGMRLKSLNLLHKVLPNVINRQLFNSLDSKFISEHVCPVYSLEDAWELDLNVGDLRDSRCGLLRASFESPLSVKALRTWSQTFVRIAASLAVIIILVKLATPKSEQQYAMVAEELISNGPEDLVSDSKKFVDVVTSPPELTSKIKELWAGIEELKSNAVLFSKKPEVKSKVVDVSHPLPSVMPILNYLGQNEDDSCGEFQLGLQKLSICTEQYLLGKKLISLDEGTSTWVDDEERNFYISRVQRIQAMKTRILQTSNNTEYLVELISEDSKSLIVDSWEGQPLKSKREAEVVAEAIAAGILSADRLEVSQVHSEARANLGSLKSSKL